MCSLSANSSNMCSFPGLNLSVTLSKVEIGREPKEPPFCLYAEHTVTPNLPVPVCKSLFCWTGYLEAESLQAANQSKADTLTEENMLLQGWQCAQLVREPTFDARRSLIIIHFFFIFDRKCQFPWRAIILSSCPHPPSEVISPSVLPVNSNDQFTLSAISDQWLATGTAVHVEQCLYWILQFSCVLITSNKDSTQNEKKKKKTRPVFSTGNHNCHLSLVWWWAWVLESVQCLCIGG